MSSLNVIIYTDGACSGNPGPGGWGSVFATYTNANDVVIYELGGPAAQTTNNRMELEALIQPLQQLSKKLTKTTSCQIQIYTDSVYVIKGATQWIHGWKKNGWKNAAGEDVTNQDLWRDLDEVLRTLKTKAELKIKWDYVRGHQGTHGNERCDQIAVAFSKNDYIDLYEGSAAHYFFDILTPPPTEPIKESNWKKDKTAAPKKSWYMVLKNGVVSRYDAWAQCEAAVKGASGVKFKKVSSDSEEADLLKSWGK